VSSVIRNLQASGPGYGGAIVIEIRILDIIPSLAGKVKKKKKGLAANGFPD
jgi:hypothetical protein